VFSAEQDKNAKRPRDRVSMRAKCATYKALLRFKWAVDSRADKPSFKRWYGLNSSTITLEELFEEMERQQLECRKCAPPTIATAAASVQQHCVGMSCGYSVPWNMDVARARQRFPD
jgi:hypothetical protein